MSCYLGFEPTTAESGYYFVSYNSDDVTRIQPLVKGLFDAGVPLWYDHALEYGKEWKKQIAGKIRNSDAVLLFMTMGVLRKEFSYVREEYEMAVDYFDKKVYVVLLDAIAKKDVPFESVPWWMEVVKNHLIDLSNVSNTSFQIAEICKAIGHSANRMPLDSAFSNGKNEQAKNRDRAPSISVEAQEDAHELAKRGENYYYGRGVEQNHREAFRCFTMAAEQGYAVGQNWVGFCCENGHGTTKDYGEALKWYRKSAEQGNAEGQWRLGACYLNGHGTTRNYDEAFKWYKKSAEQGNAWGQRYVGECYYYGRGTTQDYAEAFKWFGKSSDQGHAIGQNWVGFCYENGNGTMQDYGEALKWYRKSAEQGNAEGQWRLGACYLNGCGTARNYDEAFKWCTKSAEQGNAIGQRYVGECYYYGRGTTQNYTEAFHWFQKAAAQGNENGQSWVGFCYENGCGVEKNIPEAIRWYRKAAQYGNQYAKDRLAALGA